MAGNGWNIIYSIYVKPLDDKEQEGKSYQSASHSERDLMIQGTENSKF